MPERTSVNRIQIIAEIGQNHNGDMKLAKELIFAAKENGADVAKFQLYDVDSIFQPDFEWYADAKRAQLNIEQALELAATCLLADIEFMASVFDVERVGWCEEIGAKRYKIASRSVRNQPLLQAVALTGKDIIVSLGMWDGRGFPVISSRARVDYLYCVAKYPTALEDLDFAAIDFRRYAGFSDHTIGIDAALVAMARGAKIIEKHFTLDRNMPGPDHAGSMEPQELSSLANHAKAFSEILYHGEGNVEMIPAADVHVSERLDYAG
ncbi:MAG TPA: N-acetylneuraminate synthase family protein [Terriglobales bacterium]